MEFEIKLINFHKESEFKNVVEKNVGHFVLV